MTDHKSIDLKSYVELNYGANFKGSGRIVKCKCVLPSHDDRTPSFVVYTDTNRWRCFGCGNGGDILDLIQLTHNVGYQESLSMVNSEMTIRQPVERQRIEQPKKEAIHELWRDEWETSLKKQTEIGLWLKNRGIDENWSDTFGLGYVDQHPTLEWAKRKIAIPYKRGFDIVGTKLRKDPRLNSNGAKYLTITGSDMTMFNMDALMVGYRNYVLIETELDAIALSALLDNEYRVLAKSAGSFSENTARLLTGKFLWVVCDNDDAGKAAFANIKKLHAAARPLFVSGDFKDFGESIQNGIVPEWVEFLKELA
jgi:hypothetical protein